MNAGCSCLFCVTVLGTGFSTLVLSFGFRAGADVSGLMERAKHRAGALCGSFYGCLMYQLVHGQGDEERADRGGARSTRLRAGAGSGGSLEVEELRPGTNRQFS